MRRALGFAQQQAEVKDLSRSCWSRWVLLLRSHLSLSGSELCHPFNSTSQGLIPGEIQGNFLPGLKVPPRFSKNSDFSTTSTDGHPK